MPVEHTQPTRLVHTAVRIRNLDEYTQVRELYLKAGATVWPWHNGYVKPTTDDKQIGLYGLEPCGFLKHLHNVGGTHIKELSIGELSALVSDIETDLTGCTFTMKGVRDLISNSNTPDGIANIRRILACPVIEKYHRDFPLDQEPILDSIDDYLTDNELWGEDHEYIGLRLSALALLTYMLCGLEKTESVMEYLNTNVTQWRGKHQLTAKPNIAQ